MKRFLSIILSLFIVFSSFTTGIGFAMDPPKKSSNCQVEENNDVHIFCCADDGNAMPTCVMLASVLENAGDEKINVHIVSFQDNKMSEQNIRNIEALKNIRDFDFDFVYFDKTRLDEFDTGIWNKSIMIKLYCAELFPNLDRIIWLDDDVIVLKSLKKLYNLDMGDKYLAGVDLAPEFHNNNCLYWITAAIGLYNLKEMRKDNIQQNLLKSAREFTYKKNSVTLGGGVEEYALTYGMPKDKVLILPCKYSIMEQLYRESDVLQFEMNDIVTLHFSGPDKPWMNLRALFAKKWWEYAIKTNFFDKNSKEVGLKLNLLHGSQPQKTIDNGIYTISSKLDSNKCLAIKDGSKNNCANLQLLDRNGTNAQKFKVQYNPNGYYTIVAICSGKTLDMLGGSKNILQCTKNKRNTQKWLIVPDGEGYCFLLPKCSNRSKLCMDVSNSKTNNGTNIWCGLLNLSDAQRFKLEKCEDKPSSSKPNRVQKLVGKTRSNKPVRIKKNADKPGLSKPGNLKKSA